MFINHYRLPLLACLIVVNIISAVAHGIELRFSFGLESEPDRAHSYQADEDVFRKIKMLSNMIEDLGGFESVKNLDTPIPLQVRKAPFDQIIKILSEADKEYKALNKPDKTEKDLKGIVAKLVAKEWKVAPSDALLGLLVAANYLDVADILGAGARLWARQYSNTKNSLSGIFKYLDNDIKALIISKLAQRGFLGMMRANENPQMTDEQKAEQDNLYKLALRIHYNEQPPRGHTAKALYDEFSRLGRFVSIPGGTYMVGEGTNSHKVDLSPFSIMEAVVTQEAWARVMGSNPSKFQKAEYCPGDFKEIKVRGVKIPVCADHPVEMVSWDDANEFAKRLSKQGSYTYSLPTETQLDVAFRGGTTARYVTGRDDDVGMEEFIWHRDISGNQTHPVKSKQKNAFGIYRGSVGEWAQDRYVRDYARSTGLDPQGPSYLDQLLASSGSLDLGLFVSRGCGWSSSLGTWSLGLCASSYRVGRSGEKGFSDLGFRLVRTLPR